MNRTRKIYIDEAGRGPLAGPLVIGFVTPIKTLSQAQKSSFQDSKKLSSSQREVLFQEIQKMRDKKQIISSIISISPSEIDQRGMTKAQAIGIEKGIAKLISQIPITTGKESIMIYLDGNRDFGISKNHPERKVESIIKGDAKIKEIAMASILAKVSRDRIMQTLAPQYEKYAFAQHKGYGTKLHYEKIKEF